MIIIKPIFGKILLIKIKGPDLPNRKPGPFFRLFPRRRPVNQRKPESRVLTVAFNRRGLFIRAARHKG
jgi:hypothetical protein